MPAFKPAYLIHGDDHGRVTDRRGRLRVLADAENASFEAAGAPQASAALLSALTLTVGWRFIIADGCERWSEAEVKEHLSPSMAAIAPQTTIAFFALEDGRAKAPLALHELVKAAGGDISAEVAVKEWDLPAWAMARSGELGLSLDAAAARALVQAVGPRQARLSRELEKLSLEVGPGASLDADGVIERVARAAERKAWSLADALVARDPAAAVRVYLQLRAQGERVESLGYWMARRLREALAVATQLESGMPPAKIRSTLRMPPKAAAAFISDVGRTDASALRRALASLADLEIDSRGRSGLDPDTLALRTIGSIAA
jgi:DNA polymerase-3 subunit delta